MSLRPKHLLWAAIGAYATGFAALSILRHHAFNTGRFDLGNMTQAVWATAHGHPLAVTNLEGEQTSRLGSHVDPILVAFAPLWWIWPSPSMLLAAQAIAIALGALPVFWLARKHLGSERAALGFALAYLLYPAVQWLTLAEFHPVALACPLLLYAFWYLDEDRLVPFAAFAGLAALTKEEIPLVIAGMGIWYALSRKRYRIGGAIAGVGTVMTAFSVKVVMPHFNAETSARFYQRYGALGDSPGEILATIFTHPGRLVSTAFDSQGLHYLADLGFPLVFLFVGRTARARRGGPRARAEPALGGAHAELDPPPLHSRPHPASGGGLGPGSREARPRGAAARDPAGVSRCRGDPRRQLSPRRDPALAEPARRLLVPGPCLGRGGARPDHRSGAAAHSRRRRRQRDELARLTPLGPPQVPQLPGRPRRRVDRGRRDTARLCRPLGPGATAADLARLRRSPDWRLVFSEDGVLVFKRRTSKT